MGSVRDPREPEPEARPQALASQDWRNNGNASNPATPRQDAGRDMRDPYENLLGAMHNMSSAPLWLQQHQAASGSMDGLDPSDLPPMAWSAAPTVGGNHMLLASQAAAMQGVMGNSLLSHLQVPSFMSDGALAHLPGDGNDENGFASFSSDLFAADMFAGMSSTPNLGGAAASYLAYPGQTAASMQRNMLASGVPGNGSGQRQRATSHTGGAGLLGPAGSGGAGGVNLAARAAASTTAAKNARTSWLPNGMTDVLAQVQAAAATAAPSTSLYVRNLPPDADELMLYRTFSPIGALLSCKVHMDPATGRCRGVGFVNYADQASAIRAIKELHGVRIADGRVLHLTLQAPRAVRAAAAAAAATAAGSLSARGAVMTPGAGPSSSRGQQQGSGLLKAGGSGGSGQFFPDMGQNRGGGNGNAPTDVVFL